MPTIPASATQNATSRAAENDISPSRMEAA